MDYSFSRYLAAKRTIDDRSLNEYVWQTLQAALPAKPLAILEIGAGTGAMLNRLAHRGYPGDGGLYTAIDRDLSTVTEARRRFDAQALSFRLELESIDVYEFIEREKGHRAWDLLIAHAVLDLLDVPRVMPGLLSLLRPGGFFYFTINFDGLTILEPEIDPAFDKQVVDLYHRTMDERRIDGRLAGDSRAGRRLLTQIPASGGEILAAGSSDWIIMPVRDSYPADEAYFLHHILHFFESSLSGDPGLDQRRFKTWLAGRRAQIDAAELIYLAHQIDVCGRPVNRD